MHSVGQIRRSRMYMGRVSEGLTLGGNTERLKQKGRVTIVPNSCKIQLHNPNVKMKDNVIKSIGCGLLVW